jgi:uncharacterized protein YcbK (DUF882 family)
LFSAKRREVLKLALFLFFGSLTAYCGEIKEDETLTLNVRRGNETCSVGFISNGLLDEEKYLELCYFFKDAKADVAVKMDPRLFVVLARAQEWLRKYGYSEPFVVNSGYRTHQTNAALENSAYNSMHLYGMAADISHPRLSPEYLSVLMSAFGGLGIGVYDTFIHIDTWKKRRWNG